MAEVACLKCSSIRPYGLTSSAIGRDPMLSHFNSRSRKTKMCVCGVILAEVLQGIRSDADYRKTMDYFDSLNKHAFVRYL